MALTRKMLKAMGIEDDKIDQIIEAHTETTDALKSERDSYKEKCDSYKEDADKLEEVQSELNKLKKEVKDNDWKGKYDKEHENFEAYKKDIEDKKTLDNVKNAYKKLLSECKVGDKQIDSIMRVTDFKDMKVGEDGNLENADKLKEGINSTWSGFITTTGTKGADVQTPPDNNGANGGQGSRAAELAAKYHDNLYGKAKED